MQCDFDTIGPAGNPADIEIALVIHDLFVALGFERFEIRINNRLVLAGLLVIGGAFLAVVLFSPDGVLGLWDKLVARLAKNRGQRG